MSTDNPTDGGAQNSDTNETLSGLADFHATIETDVLTDFIDVITTVRDEAEIAIHSGGMRGATFGETNVGGVDARIGEDAFESFDVDSGGYAGLKLGELDSVLSTTDADIVELSLGEESGRLSVATDTMDYSGATVALDYVADIQPEEKFIGMFDGGPEEIVEATIPASVLNTAVSTVDLVDDHVNLEYDAGSDEISLAAMGDNSTVARTYGEDSLGDISSTIDSGMIAATYSVGYFRNHLTPISSSDDVMVKFSNEYPTLWRYTVGDHMPVIALTAPRR